ncbi:MAG: triose-phosphate isomerase [Terriglobales bacterium]
MRTKLIAANWKMYKTPADACAFMKAFLPLVANHNRDEIVICAPYVDIPAVVEHSKGSRVMVGAQDMFWEKEGAYTSQISAGMLVDAGCTHVILGHSECRQYFGDTDETVNRKTEVALEAGLTPIMCVGEVIEEREAGVTEDVLRRQISRGLAGIGKEKARKLVIAYEPVWAIGTGKTATPQIASQAHSVIRTEVANAMGRDFADNLRILYGGSVKPDNAKALMSEEEIDGALVGGASLKPDSFAAIVKY